MANPFVVIAVAASAMKAYGTLYQGYAMAAYYKGKADLALLQGRTKKVEAKETGVDKLRDKMSEISFFLFKNFFCWRVISNHF